MKLVKVIQWSVPDPVVGSRMEGEDFFDGCFGDEDEYEGNPERVYEIVDGEKVPLNIHYEGYWKNGLLAAKGTWIDGLPNGQGTLTRTDGSVQEGIWQDGEFQFAVTI